MNATIEDCRELDRRVTLLANEVVSLKEENAVMKREVARLSSLEGKRDFVERIEEITVDKPVNEDWHRRLGSLRDLLEEKRHYKI